ncbi:MAG: hypothetical protein ACLSVF_11105 [Faecalibacterium sp.]
MIIIHQERAVNDGADVSTVVVPVICHQFPGSIRKLLADTLSADAVDSGEHFRNRLFQIIVVLPHLRVTGITAHPGVRHIENVVQARESAGFVQQSDTLRATSDIAVHPAVPNIIVGTGGGIRALGVDHELVCKGVLVQPGCGGQVIRPAFPVPDQAVRRALGKGEIFFGFAWHSVPPFNLVVNKKASGLFRSLAYGIYGSLIFVHNYFSCLS